MDTVPPHQQASTRKTIIGAIGALAGGEVLARVVGLVATTLLARRLGPEGFGIIGFATAVCGYLAFAVNSGLHDVGTREIARAPKRAVSLYSSVATIRLALAVAALAVLAVVSWNLPKPPVTTLVVLLTGLSFFPLALDPTWVFKGLERPVLAGAGLVLSQVVYALAVLFLVHGPSDVTRVPVLQFVGQLAAALALCVVLLRQARPVLALTDGWRVLHAARYLVLARVFRTLVNSTDVVLLGFMTNDRQVGLYSAAYRVAFLLVSVAGSVSAAYLPSYARVIQGDVTRTRALIETSLGMAMLIGAPIVAGVIVTARPLISLLFGVDYGDAAPAMQILALSVGIVFLHWCVTNLLIVAHRTGLVSTIYGAAAAVNIALNFLLIPRFGIAGAAAATLAAEVTTLIAGIVILGQMRVLPSARSILVPVFAALGMSAVVAELAYAWPLPGQTALGALSYALFVILLSGGMPAALRRGSGEL